MRQFIKNIMIRDRLILIYSFLIILCITMISISSYYYSAKIITDEASKHIHRILEQSCENVDKTLIDMEITINTFLTQQEIYNIIQFGKSSFVSEKLNTVNLTDVLTNIALLRNEIASIFVFDYRGKIYGTQNYVGTMGVSELKAMAEQGNGKFVWMDPNKEEGVIHVVRLVKNSQLKDIGVILVSIRQSEIEKLFKWQKIATKGETFIINQTGTIMASSGDNFDDRLQDKEFLGQISSKQGRFYHVERTYANDKYIYYIYHSDYNNWKYVSVISHKELIGGAKSVRSIITLWGFLFALLFIGISFIIAYGITKPIKKITESMKAYKIKGVVPKIQFFNNDEVAYLYETFAEMTGRLNHLVETVYEQELLRRKQQFKILQSQINPHFLYNTFDIINWMARAKNAPEIGNVIKSLSNVMRYTITSDSPEVKLSDEIEHVENYMLIQKIRYGHHLRFTINLNEEILNGGILKLTLQPIIENALAHGFEGKKAKMNIEVSGYIDEDVIFLSIIDNGKGINKDKMKNILESKSQEKNDEHTGIGLFNVDQRLKLKYGEAFGLDIKSIEGIGTEVMIKLPVNQEVSDV